MNKKIHFLLLTSLTLLVMIVSALHPMIARADDSTPSAPATQPPAADTSAPAVVATQPPAADTSVAPADTSAPSADTSVAPADTSVAPVDTSVAPTDTTVAPTDTSTLVGSVPTGTSVVVLDATGTPVPLATQQAATVLSTGDPYFTIGSTTYGFTSAVSCPANVNNCISTGSSTPIQDAINYLAGLNAAPDDGNIYVEAGSYAEDVMIDGTSWMSTPASLGLIGAGSGSTSLNGYIVISNMNDFTLQGFTVSGDSSNGTYVSANSNKGTLTVNDVSVTNTTYNNSGIGITVTGHKGTIHLSGVNASGNAASGAYLSNTAGTGLITIDGNSTFNDNAGDGLDVYSNGTVTLDNVVANCNGYECSDDNIVSPGANGVYIDNTGGNGNVYIDADSTGVPTGGSSIFGDVGDGSDVHGGNSGNGLEVYSNGDVTLYNVTADSNIEFDGVSLGSSTSPIGGNIYVDTDSSGDISGSSNFGELGAGNGTNGLEAYAYGNLELANVDAEYNGGNGAYLDNCMVSGGACGGSGSVGINTYNNTYDSFSNNGSDGLDITSSGEIDLRDVVAGHNVYGTGAVLNNTGGSDRLVQLDTYNNTYDAFSSNGSDGLDITSSGEILLSDVVATYNGGAGAVINNANDGDPGVYIKASNRPHTDFNSNDNDGLDVTSTGEIHLTDVVADYNSGTGAVLNNMGGSNPWPYAISIDTSLSSYNDFSYNYNDGLAITTTIDEINLDDVVAYGNGYDGAYLDNCVDTGSGCTGSGNVTVDNSHVVGGDGFNSNSGNGLEVYSNGTITLNSVVADANNYDGAYLTTTGSDGSPNFDASIYIDADSGGPEGTWSDFSGNQGNGGTGNPAGLEAYGPDTFVLSNVSATCNGLDLTNCFADFPDFTGISNNVNGVSLDNTSGTCSGGTGFCGIWIENNVYGQFWRNSANGIAANSKGDIDLDIIYAEQNNSDGAYLENDFGSSTGGITVDNTLGGDFNDNNDSGLEAYSKGAISLTDVIAERNDPNGNGYDGVDLYNYSGPTTSTVTVDNSDLTGGDGFNGNGEDGLDVLSRGTITLTNVMANDNDPNDDWDGYGAFLRNNFPSGTGGISINQSGGTSSFSGNAGDGLHALSNGSISLTSVIADGNDWNDDGYDGAYLNNSTSTTSSTVTVDNNKITGGNGFNDNGEEGLNVISKGAITLINVNANGNDPYDNFDGDGADLKNIGGTGGIGITSGGTSSFSGNSGYGLYAVSNGSISLTNVTADGNDWNDNGYDGAYLNNVGGTSAITVNNSVFGDFTAGGNGDHGLAAISKGAISLTSVTADDNNIDGAYLANGFGSSTSGITVQASNFGESSTTGNGSDGLEAHSNGEVNLSSVSVDYNDDVGAFLTSELGSITVDPSSFNNNGQFGLGAISDGTITLNDVIADDNTLGGAFLESLSGVNVVNSHFDGNFGDGLVILSFSDATVNCGSTANNNSGYGVYGEVDGTFNNGLTLIGNHPANGVLSGTEVDTPCSGGGGKRTAPIVGGAGPLPWNVINVPDSGGQGNALSCSQYVGTELDLPNGDRALLPCPIGSTPGTSGSLTRVNSDKLPGKLDSKFTFVSSFDAEVNPSLTGGMLTVSFAIPTGKQGANFAILHWDGTKWVNLGGSINPPGYFSVTTSLTGDFVLVTQ